MLVPKKVGEVPLLSSPSPLCSLPTPGSFTGACCLEQPSQGLSVTFWKAQGRRAHSGGLSHTTAFNLSDLWCSEEWPRANLWHGSELIPS